MAKPGPVCGYCPDFPRAELVDASEVYGPTYAGKFNIWQCRGCGAYVGAACGEDPRPLGTLANEETRKLRGRLRDAIKAEFAKLAAIPKKQKTVEHANRRRELDDLMTRVMRMQAEDCRKVLMTLVQTSEEMFVK